MEVVCPVCREVVHVSAGLIMRHGSKYHLKYHECAGSLTPYCVTFGTCCN